VLRHEAPKWLGDGAPVGRQWAPAGVLLLALGVAAVAAVVPYLATASARR
jgi:hypothetical protein